MAASSTTAESESAQANGRYTVIARRYRPQAFDELVGQEHVARALQQAISSDRVGHAYLFTGARGTGKTSAARILAKALNCVHGPTPTPCNDCEVCRAVSTGDDIDVLEIDGASNNGVDQVRQLRQNAAVRPTRTRYKIYIIDEVHMLSASAFNALLKTLEEPPEHVKFIFATTEPQKIPITILSRCQRFDFAGISSAAIQARLAQIAEAEGVAVDADALQILASRAAGSMRDSQSLLEQLLAVGGERVTAADVNNLLGIAPAERLSGLVQHLVNRDAPGALAELESTIRSGVEVGLLLDQLVGYFRDVMALCVGCQADQMLYALPSQADEVRAIGQQLGISTVLAIGQILDHTSARMRVSMHGRTLVEMAIVRICQIGELEELATIVAELRGAAPGDQPTNRAAGVESARGGRAPSALPTMPARAADPSKKNGEPPAAASLGNGLASAVASAIAASPAAPPRTPVVPSFSPSSATAPPGPPQTLPVSRRIDLPEQPIEVNRDPNEALAEITQGEDAGYTPAESVLAQFQRAMAHGGVPQRAETAPMQKSRREMLAEIAEQPIVKRAMELFDVEPGKFKYVPPEGDSN
ncbi:MAG: DNA polymerase III subunit gamma/tau [Pirellulales bacterium]